jgi:glycosyltransferase involved in cell wall biosynthesis
MQRDVPLLSLVLPVHNQGEHIRSIVEGYIDGLEVLPISYEIILIVNGSTDDSQAVCDALAAEFDGVQALALQKRGWGHSVRTGLSVARGDLLCFTNSARTTREILMLTLAYSLAYPEVVLKANRRIRESRRRRLGSLLYNIECRALFDLSVWDINGTPKIFPRTFDKLLALTRDDDLLDCEFNVVCRANDYPMIEVPILATERHGGRSTTRYSSAIRMYVGAYAMWRARRASSLS